MYIRNQNNLSVRDKRLLTILLTGGPLRFDKLLPKLGFIQFNHPINKTGDKSKG